MKEPENEILEIADNAGLKISLHEKTVSVNQILRLKNKSTIGLILFLIGAFVFFWIAFMNKNQNIVSILICILFGLLFFSLSVLSLIRQAFDYVTIRDKHLYFRYNLKSFSAVVDKSMAINMKTEVMQVRRSSFIYVTLFVKLKDKEVPILNFHMDRSESAEAHKIGNYITRILNKKLDLIKEGIYN